MDYEEYKTTPENLEFERAEAVSTCYHAGELYSVDLWSQEQQKCVMHRLVRSDKHVTKGVQGYFVKAVSDKGVQYLLVTDREYEIMKKKSKNPVP